LFVFLLGKNAGIFDWRAMVYDLGLKTSVLLLGLSKGMTENRSAKGRQTGLFGLESPDITYLSTNKQKSQEQTDSHESPQSRRTTAACVAWLPCWW
jgi:hypothetical protein